MAQITSITSEALQAKIRQLLPSQQGFGEDLQAQNVIVPVIDLTNAAEGLDVPLYQQQAFSFADITSFQAVNTTVTLANTPGFWRVYGMINAYTGSSAVFGQFEVTDGAATKTIASVLAAGGVQGASVPFDFIFFLTAGETISATSSATTVYVTGNYRQVADVNGIPINPTGFTPQ